MPVRAAILFLLWLAFTGQWQWHELVTGAAATVLAVTGLELARRVAQRRFRPRAAWLLGFWRTPLLIVRDCFLLALHLPRARGVFRTVPFPDSGDEAEVAARRALALTYATLPPNSLVIGIDRTNHTMLLHEIHPTGGRPWTLG